MLAAILSKIVLGELLRQGYMYRETRVSKPMLSTVWTVFLLAYIILQCQIDMYSSRSVHVLLVTAVPTHFARIAKTTDWEFQDGNYKQSASHTV